MTITDLKQGDVIYNIENYKIIPYYYHEKHPGNEKYHLLFDNHHELITWNDGFLQNLLNLNFNNYIAVEAYLKILQGK